MQSRRLAWSVAAYLICGTAACSQKPAVEQKLAPEEIALTLGFDATQGVPESFTVNYVNTSATRGYVELPCPLRGELHSEYRTPSLALSFDQSSGDLKLRNGGGVFLYAPSGDAKPPRATIAVLDPKASISVDYKTAEFCMIGHGIAPDADANVRTCFKKGNIAFSPSGNFISVFLKDTSTAQKYNMLGNITSDNLGLLLSVGAGDILTFKILNQ